MGLISAIKSVLGLGGPDDRSRDRSTGTNVTVEREADATSERAVKESDATEVTVKHESGTTGDGVADTADAGTSGETEDAGDTGTAPEDADQEGTEEGKTDTKGGASVEEIKGIGPTYAERLADAGVQTVSELAAADAAELGSKTGVGESRVANWIERASEYC
ncbi:MAG: helix-hairpin-helix domain-containing protein [Halobacteriales archaeon]